MLSPNWLCWSQQRTRIAVTHVTLLPPAYIWMQDTRTNITFIAQVEVITIFTGRSQWPCGLRRRSAATRLLRSWVRIPQGAWTFFCCECCVLSGRGLCDELITRPEESYRLWCVVVCYLETSRTRRPWPALGHSATPKKKCLKRNTLLRIYPPWHFDTSTTFYPSVLPTFT